MARHSRFHEDDHDDGSFASIAGSHSFSLGSDVFFGNLVNVGPPPGGGGPGGGGGKGGGGSGGNSVSYFSGSGNGEVGFDIWIEFKGSAWTTDYQQAIIDAADYFTDIITEDISGGGLYRGKVIDDLYVAVELKRIDSEGGVLAKAGPSATWVANDLTAAGVMQFDIADASALLLDGLWDDAVTHELLHILGFGTLWDYGSHAEDNLVDGFQYIGSNALSAYRATAGNSKADYIPIEDTGGPGTVGAHWDEELLGNELMTGYINDDGVPTDPTDNYLSAFSVQVLADLGYVLGNYYDYPYDDPLTV